MEKIKLPNAGEIKNIAFLIGGVLIFIMVWPAISGLLNLTRGAADAVKAVLDIPGDVAKYIDKNSVANTALLKWYKAFSKTRVFNPNDATDQKLLKQLKTLPFDEAVRAEIIATWKSPKLGLVAGAYKHALAAGMQKANADVLASVGSWL